MPPLGLFSPSLWPDMSTLSSNVHSCKRHYCLMCQYGSRGCYLEQRQSNIELVISHHFLQEENGNGSLQSVLPLNWKQLWNVCAIKSVLGTFLLGIMSRKKVSFLNNPVWLANTEGLKTGKSRWHQDLQLYFPCWHWSSEEEYVQAWQKHELSSPCLDLGGFGTLTTNSSS